MERQVIAVSRILIVDDLPANVLLLERVLQQAGYKNYLSLTDSRDVLDSFRTFQPDLILLDLMMPKLDGYAVIKQLNGWVPDGVYLPILVVTADTSRAARQKALGLGAKDFLTKPIDTAEATLRIGNLLLTRWLYRQMESRNQSLVANAAVAKRRMQTAMKELDRIGAKERVLAGDLISLQCELSQAAEAVEALGVDGAPGLTPAPGVPPMALAGPKPALADQPAL